VSAVSTQSQVLDWFDGVYRERGLAYLRPPQAYPIFLQLLQARPGERILDVACGPGLLLRAARERSLEATGIDLSRVALGMVDRVAPGAGRLQANAERLPFASGTFDLVTCIGSLERFLDRREALREMRRVARREARFCLMVRNARTFGWRVRKQWLGTVNRRGHQDAATLDQWTGMFDECGFRVRAVVPDQWFFQKWRNRITAPRAGVAEPVVTRLAPLAFANEFIFILERGA
jgi:SAM-dependent methyltransferase